MSSPPKLGFIEFSYRLKDVVGIKYYSLDSLGSELQQFDLGIPVVSQDKIEVRSLRVVDSTQLFVIAEVGQIIGLATKPVLTWPLVYVVGSPSSVCFTRGGDTFLYPNGKWSVGFDALRECGSNNKLNNSGNYAEIEYQLNDGPWIVDTVEFDVLSGKSRPNGRPGKHLEFHVLDKLLVKRVDVFDSSNQKFATMGVRMGSQGHYREQP
jgi:hypothetical protein